MSQLPQLRDSLVRAGQRRIEGTGTQNAAQLRGHARRASGRRHSLHRWPALFSSIALGLASTAVGAVQIGSPLVAEQSASRSAGEGVAVPGAGQLLSLRVPDPRGGPPWGLRIQRTTGGRTCVQVGRVEHGQLGALGRDGAFADDGRFHPLASNDVGGAFACAIAGQTGQETIDVALRDVPASALDGLIDGAETHDGGCSAPMQIREAALAPCPAPDMRDVYFGLLGSSAVAFGHTSKGPMQRTSPPDGAYLVVVEHRSHCTALAGGGAGEACATLPRAEGSSEPLPEALAAVAYSDGSVRRLTAP